MNRRSFLVTGTATALASVAAAPSLLATQKPPRYSSALRKAMQPQPLSIDAGLEPYTPSAANPWDTRTAGHLLRRAGFQATTTDIAFALTLTPQQAVEKLVATAPEDYPSEYSADDRELWGMKPSWEQEEHKRYTTPDEILQYQVLLRTRMGELQRWWLERMYRSSLQRSGAHTAHPLVEKMTLFWHNHFTSDWQKVNLPQMMFIQNNALRAQALGNFKAMARMTVSDPAMLLYLDGATNTRLKPNENYARELLELFTLGEGHYSEHDIVETARVTTGWLIKLTYPFVQFEAPNFRLHDYNEKTVLGARIVSDLVDKAQSGAKEADQLIDAIFQHTFARNDAELQQGKAFTAVEAFKGKNVAAVFLAAKLYRFFVYEIIDERIVAQLADLIAQNNFEVKPALQTLLGSAHFFDAQLHGAMIKSPIDMLVGIMRQYQVALPANDSPTRPFLRTVLESAILLGMELLSPPTVAGWKGYHTWINTTTYPSRNVMSDAFVFGKDAGGRPLRTQIDVRAFGSWFASLPDAEAFIADAARFILPMEIDKQQKDELLEELLQSAQPYEWTDFVKNDPDKTTLRLQMFLRALMRLPEFQLT